MKRYIFDDYAHEITPTERVRRWNSGPIRVYANPQSSCQECEEDIDMRDHYPYVFKEINHCFIILYRNIDFKFSLGVSNVARNADM